MAKWGRANTVSTKTIRPDGDEENFIEIRTEISKGEANHLMQFAPLPTDEGRVRMQKTVEMLEESFNVFVHDWSLVDDEDNRIVPSVEAYRTLPADVGKFIDDAVQEELGRAMGFKNNDDEGKATA